MGQHVVIDATSLFYRGGVSRSVSELLGALSCADSDLELSIVTRAMQRKARMTHAPSFRHRHFPLPRISESLIRRSRLIERMTQGNLFHATDHVMAIHASSPAVATIHDTLYFSHFVGQWEAHHHFRKAVRRFLSQCKAVITCSESTKRDIIQHFKFPSELIFVIPWGIDQNLFCPPACLKSAQETVSNKFSLPRPFFFTASCDTARKNTPFLLECYMELLDEGVSSDLVLAWDPPPSVREKYSHSSIRFLGRVSDEDLALLYQSASGFLFPSRYEGFGFPVLEAMACRTPVVTSDTSSLPEVGGDIALYCSPESKQELKCQIRKLVDQGSEIEERTLAGVEHARAFTWEKCAQKTLSAYKKCL